MKKKSILKVLAIALTATFYLTSCGQKSNDAHEHDEEEHSEEHSDNDGDSASSEDESHEHDAHEHEHGGGAEMTMGEAKTWMPAGNAADAIAKDFHFITGSIDDLSAEVITDEKEAGILKLSPSTGNPASFVFHSKFSNVGVSVALKRENFEGEFKIVHHAKDADTYEFVSVNGSQMKLGRMVAGEESIFDEASFESDEWLILKVSAAGAHYKGYIGDQTTTHGHGDEMEAGYVGIMIAGTGTVQIKQIEVTPIEAE